MEFPCHECTGCHNHGIKAFTDCRKWQTWAAEENAKLEREDEDDAETDILQNLL